MRKARKKRLTVDVLDSLIEELEGVRSLLPSASVTIDEEDEEDDDRDTEPGKIESEEIEVALSAVVSSLSDRCDLPTEPESLSELLAAFFSSADDLVSLAVNLEDAVNGYFGELFGENLDLADDYFLDLIAALKERRKKWRQHKG